MSDDIADRVIDDYQPVHKNKEEVWSIDNDEE